MADMDLGLDMEDLGLNMEDLGISMEEMEQLAVDDKVELAENLDGFAKGFSADWDVLPPKRR